MNVPNSFSNIYYTNRKLYNILTVLLVILTWVTGESLDLPWVTVGGFMAFGLSWIAGDYMDTKWDEAHYIFALLFFAPLVYYAGWSSLIIPSAIGVISFLFRKKLNIWLLVFELSLYAVTMIKLWT